MNHTVYEVIHAYSRNIAIVKFVLKKEKNIREREREGEFQKNNFYKKITYTNNQ